MRITISTAAANDELAHEWLDRIIVRIIDQWHVWDTTAEDDPDRTFGATTWVADSGRQGARLRELLMKSTERSAWSAPSGRRVLVTLEPKGPGEYTPHDACRLAEQPLVILVENRHSDGPFLKRLVQEIDPDLYQLWHHRHAQPIELDSVGGLGQMPAEVKRRKSKSPLARLLVVADSDRKSDTDPPSACARRLKRECARYNVPCWILNKREADNYIPNTLLRAWPNSGAEHSRRVAAWTRLTPTQRDFLDIKNGLSASPSAGEEKLFRSVSTSDRRMLATGFGKMAHQCWSVGGRDVRDELLERGGSEVTDGVRMIGDEV